jgi:chromosomal replication initiator protein
LSPENIWEKVSRRLKQALSPEEFQIWFAPLDLKIENSRAVMVVPNHFYADWIQERYRLVLEQALAGILDTGLPLVFESKPQEQGTPSPTPKKKPASKWANPLSRRYTFDTFVVGPCNDLAQAACMAVAENPGRQYNPLFVFGRAGLGKTHLLHAVGNYLLERRPSQKVLYSSLESFTNELIHAVRYEGIHSFKEKYRQLDCLLLDDVQFLAGRERTQEELFHIFNTMFEAGKQIVVTSDKMPREIPSLEKRLRTRFEWGLLADLQPPDEETKVAILQRKASERGLEISKKVAFYLAQQPESNIRVLEGYLNRVIAVSRFRGQELNLDLARQVVTPMAGERKVSPDDVLRAVAANFGVKISDLKGSRKTREISQPRQVAMYLIRKMTSASYPEIGRLLGGKDHSTIVKGAKKLKDQLDRDPELKERVRTVERTLVERESIQEKELNSS